MRTIILGATLAATMLTGCASASYTAEGPEALPYTEQPARPSTTLIDHKPDVQLDEATEALTDFEAALICSRGKQSFESAAAIDTARDALLETYSLSVDEYKAFKVEYDASRDIRDVVLYKYQETCS